MILKAGLMLAFFVFNNHIFCKAPKFGEDGFWKQNMNMEIKSQKIGIIHTPRTLTVLSPLFAWCEGSPIHVNSMISQIFRAPKNCPERLVITQISLISQNYNK